MEEATNRKFENQWQQAFADAEWQPSEKVWSNVELQLQKSESGQMKKRLLFFQLLAAASVAFAMTIGGVGVYHLLNEDVDSLKGTNGLTENKGQEIINDDTKITAEESKTASTEIMDESVTPPGHSNVMADKQPVTTNQGGKSMKNVIPVVTLTTDEKRPKQEIKSAYNPSFIVTIKDVQLFNAEWKVAFTIPEKIDPITDYALLLQSDYSPSTLEKQNGQNEKLWTGISMAAGTFGTAGAYGQADFALSSGLESSTTRPSSNAGSTFRLGMMMGSKISERWVLQGGVAYMQQFTDYVSNIASQDGRVMANFNSVSSEAANIGYTLPYQLNSNQQFISIPVQAGYLLVDRKFGLQLNGGMATDLFIQNTMSDPNGNLNSFSERAGDQSAYRAVNFSGLAGTELSYRLGDNYRLVLAPGFRYAMHSILKSETNTTLQPFTFDLALKFNYLFN